MKKKIIKGRGLWFLFVTAIVMTLFLSSFVISFLRSEYFYKKSQIESRPYLKSEKLNYYVKVLYYIDKAINSRGDNAEYYAAKADYLLSAADDGLKEELSIDKEEIEYLIKSAIRLNPTNFKYYLKLGWLNKDKEKGIAEGQLLKAAGLNSMEPQVYLFLARYYNRKKDFKNAFHNLMLFFCYSEYSLREQLNRMKEELKEDTPLSFDKKTGRMKYTVIVGDREFDFKNEGFLHISTPLRPVVYADKPSGEIGLYKDDILCGKFESRGTGKDNISRYALGTHYLPPGIYFDELKIKAAPPLVIEKIEFLRRF